MNVYDCANELAKALKESHEFKKLQEARVVLKKDAQAEELANDFIKLSSEIELAKYQKQEVDKEKRRKAAETFLFIKPESDSHGISACVYALPDDDGRYYQND